MRLLLLLLFIILFGCNSNDNSKNKEEELQFEDVIEPMIKANITLNANEDEAINDYINRYGWNLKKTNTGIRYGIYKKGTGTFANRNHVAIVSYKLSLLNGNTAYIVNDSTPEHIVISKTEIRGLEEALLLLREGDHAIIIIPSVLGYGLLGDEKRIPSRATLIYDLKLLSLY